MEIPFNRPYLTGKEIKYIKNSLNRRKLSGDGYYTKKVNEFIENTFHTPKALLTTSGSAALDMAALLLNLQPEDEIILPSYTFVSTANSFLLTGAKLVFAEIKEDTLNINPKDVKEKITSKTKAIVPVHYAGVACDMDAIMEIANKKNIKIIEDAAQGVNAKYKGKYLGTIGDIGCYSFHETKNYSCGEGGAILINKDKELIERAEIIREKGTNRSKFFRGEIDKYTWVDIGSSFLPSEILAAFLYAQFEQLDEINNKRKFIFNYYFKHLKELEDQEILRLPIIPEGCECNAHMFYILLNSEKERNKLMDKLKEKNILSVFHYLPLHTSPMGKKLGYKKGDLPITENISGRLLRLPMYADLKVVELDYIMKELYNIINDRGKKQ
jgi:dTDP-4-amino-4,6-dideoxygalactose transaminase